MKKHKVSQLIDTHLFPAPSTTDKDLASSLFLHPHRTSADWKGHSKKLPHGFCLFLFYQSLSWTSPTPQTIEVSEFHLMLSMPSFQRLCSLNTFQHICRQRFPWVSCQSAQVPAYHKSAIRTGHSCGRAAGGEWSAFSACLRPSQEA